MIHRVLKTISNFILASCIHNPDERQNTTSGKSALNQLVSLQQLLMDQETGKRE
jgi:hypothetical protein